jgi:hypothetical protein
MEINSQSESARSSKVCWLPEHERAVVGDRESERRPVDQFLEPEVASEDRPLVIEGWSGWYVSYG